MNERLAHAPLGRLLLSLTVPAILAQLVSFLYVIIDRIYIGHMPEIGEAALSGVGICAPITTIIGSTAALFGQGGAPLAMIAVGSRDIKKGERILGNCTICLVLSALGITVFFLVFAEPILRLFGSSDVTSRYAYMYMQIYIIGSVFITLSTGLTFFLTAQGYTRYSMIGILAGTVCNVLLDPLFIYGFQMGIRGAAVATVISQILNLIIVLYFLCGKHTTLQLRWSNLLPDYGLLAGITALGLSPCIMQLTETLVNISYNHSLQKYGGDAAVGAMTIAATVMQFFFLSANGLGQGVQSIVSYNYGAKNVDRFKSIVRLFLVVNIAFMFVCWIAAEWHPEFFVKMLSSTDGELYHMSIRAVRIYTATMFVYGLQSGPQKIFVAVGEAKLSIFIACLRKVILILPLIYILPCFLEDKIFAIFLTQPLGDLISALTAGCIFWIKYPKLIKSMEDADLAKS